MHGKAITMRAVRNEPVTSDTIPTTSGPSDALDGDEEAEERVADAAPRGGEHVGDRRRLARYADDDQDRRAQHERQLEREHSDRERRSEQRATQEERDRREIDAATRTFAVPAVAQHAADPEPDHRRHERERAREPGGLALAQVELALPEARQPVPEPVEARKRDGDTDEQELQRRHGEHRAAVRPQRARAPDRACPRAPALRRTHRGAVR